MAALLLLCAALFLVWKSPSITGTAVSFAMGMIFAGIIAFLLSDIGGDRTEERERGARLVASKQVARMTKSHAHEVPIVFGGVALPASAEPYHLLLAGSTGSGKSVAIKGLLDTLRKRGDTAIIVDSGGEFAARYFAETDHLINPYDARCAAWNPMSELRGEWDCDSLARSIVPDGEGDSKEWNGYAQTFISSVMRALLKRNDLTLSALLIATQIEPLTGLKALLVGTPAYAFLGSEQMFKSIRAIAARYLSVYNQLADETSTFSITDFIQKQTGGFLYLTYREDQLDSLKNLIAFALDVASRTILSLKPDSRRRIWLIIDEFASVGKVQSIEAVATKARKAGGCLLIGLQSVSQLQATYGEKPAQTILSCLSSWLVLRCADGETAEYISQYLGEEDVRQTFQNSSRNSGGSGTGISSNTSVVTRRIVMASQVQELETLHGYLRITGGYPVCSIQLTFPDKRNDVTEPFVMRDFARRPPVDLTPSDAQITNGSETTASRAVESQSALSGHQDYVHQIDQLKKRYLEEINKPNGGNSLVIDDILADLQQIENTIKRG